MATAPAQQSWTHRRALANGLHLHYVEAGVGPVVVLLHGFPEFWYAWRHQIPALANAGFHVVAPDLRGYNESDKPAGVGHYRLPLLMQDVAALIAHLSATRVALVGHDWGGIIAWQLARDRPELVGKLIVLNAPHPAAFRRELLNLDQWIKSWYVLFFQLPWLPERLLAAGNFARLERIWRHQPIHAGTFTPEEIRLYKQALNQPGALTAALNYYRAVFRYPAEQTLNDALIQTPTLLIWGEQDPYLGLNLTKGLSAWVPHLQIERIPDASHWVQNDTPERVNRLIVAFLSKLGAA